MPGMGSLSQKPARNRRNQRSSMSLCLCSVWSKTLNSSSQSPLRSVCAQFTCLCVHICAKRIEAEATPSLSLLTGTTLKPLPVNNIDHLFNSAAHPYNTGPPGRVITTTKSEQLFRNSPRNVAKSQKCWFSLRTLQLQIQLNDHVTCLKNCEEFGFVRNNLVG